MKNIAERVLRLRPELMKTWLSAWYTERDEKGLERLVWNDALGQRPTESELAAVDLAQPTAEETTRGRAIQILKTDVPDAWRDSANAQQRIAWACKRLFMEVRRELSE